jgi:hypothetical protein
MRWGRFGKCIGIGLVLWLGLVTSAVQPTRGDQGQAPPAGAHRLIRIGPQALVSEDENGKLRMVEEPAPERSRIEMLEAMLGAAAAGVLYTIYDGLGPAPPTPLGVTIFPAGDAGKR